MALKAFLDSLDGLNPVIAAEYAKAEDGKFYLQAEGMILKSKFDGKLQESNKTNASLSQQIAELRALAESRVDRADVEKLQALLDDMENGKGGEKFAKALETKIAAYKATAEENLAKARAEHLTAKQEAEAARSQLKTFKINQEVQAAASAVGLRGKNAPDYLRLASGDFDIDESTDKVVAVKRSKGPDGKEVVTPLLGEDYNPISIKEYIAKNHRSERFDVFFDSGSGTGAPGQQKPAGSPGGVYLTREQAKNPITYQQAKDTAAKAGQTVTIEQSKT